MDGWTIFFVITLVAAVFTTVFVFVKKKINERETPPKTTSPSPEYMHGVTLTKGGEAEETLPANVAIIYEGLRSGAAKHCRFCGCKYAWSVTICEICGEKL